MSSPRVSKIEGEEGWLFGYGEEEIPSAIEKRQPSEWEGGERGSIVIRRIGRLEGGCVTITPHVEGVKIEGNVITHRIERGIRNCFIGGVMRRV